MIAPLSAIILAREGVISLVLALVIVDVPAMALDVMEVVQEHVESFVQSTVQQHVPIQPINNL